MTRGDHSTVEQPDEEEDLGFQRETADMQQTQNVFSNNAFAFSHDSYSTIQSTYQKRARNNRRSTKEVANNIDFFSRR